MHEAVERILMPTTLQINLAPTDLPHLVHTLPHQIRQLGGQVDEILLTLDLHKSRGRYGTAWKERLPGFLAFLKQQAKAHAKIRTHEVDYSAGTVRTISEQFFGGKFIPPKDRNGAPFYAYFAGISNARHDYIFHINSDMMFGGGSQVWIAEAKRLMEARPEVMVCVPTPDRLRPTGRCAPRPLHASLIRQWPFAPITSTPGSLSLPAPPDLPAARFRCFSLRHCGVGRRASRAISRICTRRPACRRR